MSSEDQDKFDRSVRRLGVFGGTFDPVHNTHLDIAHAAQNHSRLDRVLFVVSARPPHKETGVYATPEERYAMVCAALEDRPALEPSRLELDRPGHSYTCDTLRRLHTRYPDTALFLILGFDSLVDLPNWKAPEEILALARLLVVPRPGPPRAVPRGVQGHYELVPFDAVDLSSTEVRERVIAGAPYDDLVPPAVGRLIRTQGIYRVGAEPEPSGGIATGKD